MREVLVSARGQHDNLGDSVLRRGLLDALRPLGRLHVDVRGLHEGYLAALGLHGEDVRVNEGWGRLVVAASSRGAVYGFNAGETYANRAYAGHLGKMAPLLVASRARGGAAFHLGLGLRAPHRGWAAVLRGTLAACDVVAWRDEDSRRWVGRGEVQPDWAYAHGAPDEDVLAAASARGRELLVVSLRGDRPAPGSAWMASVAALGAEHGLDVVVAPQVGRDGARAAELARTLGELVPWDGQDHAQGEAQLRALYARARYVVSDRLHALVLGHTEGALPLGLAPHDPAKLHRTLAAVGAGDCAWRSLGPREDLLRVAALEERRGELLAAVVEARARLARLRERLVATVQAREGR